MSGRIGKLAGHLAVHPLCGGWELARVLRNRALGRTALQDAPAWMPFPALEYLSRELRPADRVFEFGSGGSTLFFSRRVSSVISVEHDERWAGALADRLATLQIRNVTLHAAPATEDSDPAEFSSHLPVYTGHSFRRYVSILLEEPPASLDWVIVDGRARNACLKAARDRVKPGGRVVLDNSDRDRYAEGIAVYADWPRLEFRGLNPYQPDPGQTTIWTRPEGNGA